jgi:hypothetical protein
MKPATILLSIKIEKYAIKPDCHDSDEKCKSLGKGPSF